MLYCGDIHIVVHSQLLPSFHQFPWCLGRVLGCCCYVPACLPHTLSWHGLFGFTRGWQYGNAADLMDDCLKMSSCNGNRSRFLGSVSIFLFSFFSSTLFHHLFCATPSFYTVILLHRKLTLQRKSCVIGRASGCKICTPSHTVLHIHAHSLHRLGTLILQLCSYELYIVYIKLHSQHIMVIEGTSHRETEIACLENKGVGCIASVKETLCVHMVCGKPIMHVYYINGCVGSNNSHCQSLWLLSSPLKVLSSLYIELNLIFICHFLHIL